MTREHPLILIADDDPDFKEILSAKLLAQGFEIAEANNGQEAITKAKSLIPDLIIMDIQMPDVNGTEAVLDIRRSPDLKDTRIVFFSNLVYPWPGVKGGNENFAKELGAVTFLKKGDDLDLILKKINDLLAQGGE
ncbi:MAG: response regulator [Candidatus Harrisonbacteria bacterium]|nr:response regulator [Candidatus Harrisonbacteria bacterium]